MDAALAALEGTGVAQWLRGSRWGYAGVNATHILGIALLVGAIVPLNLRLLGFWRSIPREALARVLVPVAASGLALAVSAGLLLFSVRAGEYAQNPFLLAKLPLVVAGTLSALWLHWSHGLGLEGASRGRLATHAAVSLACWLAALACGRLIAFVG